MILPLYISYPVCYEGQRVLNTHVEPSCRVAVRGRPGFWTISCCDRGLWTEARPLISCKKESIARFPFGFGTPGGGDGALVRGR